ncbi:MAG: succinylglutamate desuccinylase/aspartoacylase family protein [Gluconobacter sp.]
MSCKAGQRHHPIRLRQPRLTEDLPGSGRPAFPLNVCLNPPDLSAWRNPASGISGVMIFESGRSGPEVVISGMVHGNEYAGGHALERLRKTLPVPEVGRVTLILANLEAFDRFDRSAPMASRYREEDLNRLWHPSRLSNDEQSCELARARELRPFIERADLLLDLHSTLWPSHPLFIVPPRRRSSDLACALASEAGSLTLVLTDLGHHGGSRLIEHARFMAVGGTGRSCLLEAGLHWEPETVDVMEKVSRRFLAESLNVHIQGIAQDKTQPARLAVVTDNVTAKSGEFSFVQPWIGNTCIPRAGTVIARDGHDAICTPYDDCLLIVPNLRPKQGQLAVRGGRPPPVPRNS